jgi:hypothetical protein
VALAAASIADDVGYVALADVSQTIGGVTEEYRIIGGHMVTTLVARWRLGAGLYRETGDVDLGLPTMAAKDHGVVGRLKDADYRQVAGNRFAKSLSDIPAGLSNRSGAPSPQALIDVLVPTYTSRARENVAVTEELFATEVPGLGVALNRPPVELTLYLRRLNGDTCQVELLFPDEVSALVLKSLATHVRHRDTDIGDVWRCLEIAYAAGAGPADFARGVKAEGAARIRELFSNRRSPGTTALADVLRLPAQAADERYTRIRALADRVIGSA